MPMLNVKYEKVLRKLISNQPDTLGAIASDVLKLKPILENGVGVNVNRAGFAGG